MPKPDLEERIIPTRSSDALLTKCLVSGACYLYLDKNTRDQAGIVDRTESIVSGLLLDYDAEGKLIGVEIA